MNNYDENNYLDHYRDIKIFYKQYIGESMISPILTYDKTKKISLSDIWSSISSRS